MDTALRKNGERLVEEVVSSEVHTGSEGYVNCSNCRRFVCSCCGKALQYSDIALITEEKMKVYDYSDKEEIVLSFWCHECMSGGLLEETTGDLEEGVTAKYLRRLKKLLEL